MRVSRRPSRVIVYGSKPGDLGGEGLVADALEPVGEVVFAPLEPQARLEHVKVDRVDAHGPQDRQESGQVPRLLAGREDERPAGQEMELFPLGAGRERRPALPDVGLEDLDEPLLEGRDRPEPDRVDAGQPFPERVETEGARDPEGEIVGRFRRQVVVLLEEAVGMVIDRGPRGGPQSLQEFGDAPGLHPQEQGQVEPGIELEFRSHDVRPASSFR